MAASSLNPRIECPYKDNISIDMKSPHDVICHRGKYIVTNIGNHRVISIDPGDGSSRVLCKNTDGLQRTCKPMEPYSIVALSEDKDEFLFTEIKNGCILHLDNDQPCRIWSDEDLGRPTGITINKSGDQIFVADCDDSKHRIIVFDIKGIPLRTFGAENLSFPRFIAFNSKGNLYVADDSQGVTIFNPDGARVEDPPISIKTENTKWKSRGIAIDKFDNIFVTKRTVRSRRLFSYEKVTVFDCCHDPVDNFGGWFQFNFIRGICFDYKRNLIVVVDGEWHRLQRYKLYVDPPSSIRETKPTQSDHVAGFDNRVVDDINIELKTASQRSRHDPVDDESEGLLGHNDTAQRGIIVRDDDEDGDEDDVGRDTDEEEDDEILDLDEHVRDDLRQSPTDQILQEQDEDEDDIARGDAGTIFRENDAVATPGNRGNFGAKGNLNEESDGLEFDDIDLSLTGDVKETIYSYDSRSKK